MQLAGRDGKKLVWGPPKDEASAIAVLREAVAAGVDHIDTSDFYGPHVTNQIIRKALHPYSKNLTIVTKLGAQRPADGSWAPAMSPDQLKSGSKTISATSAWRRWTSSTSALWETSTALLKVRSNRS